MKRRRVVKLGEEELVLFFTDDSVLFDTPRLVLPLWITRKEARDLVGKITHWLDKEKVENNP